jgi:hypothetical protein
MNFDKKEMLEALKLEILFIERGGYDPSVHSPHDEPRVFRDSMTCLNLGLPDTAKKDPCSSCFLIEFVPSQYRNSNDDPCHKIPLNEQGETVESLANDPERRKKALLAWLRKKVAELEAELAANK